jgi:hypothetical protein
MTGNTCQHEPDVIIESADDVIICRKCAGVIAWKCDKCRGEGVGEENELECDWINYGNRLVTCNRCAGDGWEYCNGYDPTMVESE